MRSEKLTLGHKELLYQRLRDLKTAISEYSFANLYLFRHSHDYEVLFDKELFIKGKTYDKKIYLMPAFDIKNADMDYIKSVLNGADFLFPIDEAWIEPFGREGFICSANDGDADYIYTVEKMATFKGGRLSKKRNLLKQFLARHKPQGMPLTGDRSDDARTILEEWLKDTGLTADETDYAPALEMLSLFDKLVLCGGIYYVDGEPAGFVMGEELDHETFALHFAKGKKKFKGLYQYMYNDFAKLLPEKYKYFNFEQDLGKLALKIAKSSYNPDRMLQKYRVGLKQP
ncbi:MAG: phosphatidylglycerol lysyltransferase domain-containing protein [Candidatus Omnitrophota bacterium]